MNLRGDMQIKINEFRLIIEPFLVYFKKKPTQYDIEIYYNFLKHYDIQQLKGALFEIMGKESFLPDNPIPTIKSYAKNHIPERPKLQEYKPTEESYKARGEFLKDFRKMLEEIRNKQRKEKR